MIWSEELPTKSGKYIVQTKTLFGRTITLDAKLTITNERPHWSFTNQFFYRYLKQ